jgi:hypothetical protein
MKKLIIIGSIIAIVAPMISFAQITPVGGCMTVLAGEGNINIISCINNSLLELTRRVNALEQKIADLESRTTPGPLTPVPTGGNSPAYPSDGNYPPTATQSGVIQQGASSNEVKAVQEFLKAEGSFAYPTATGYFGSITTEAVKTFQAKRGLTQTGAVDSKTLEVMKSSALQVAPSVNNAIQSITVPSR